MILAATGLRARYPEAAAPALDGVDVTLAAGELLAVVGPNGSGKSTLVRALLGLLPLEAGASRIDGRLVGDWPRDALARRVAAVPQSEAPAFPLRVHEAALLGRYAHLGPVAPPGEADRAAVRRALERCDAWALRDRRTDTLSGGEWQRVRLARALAAEPAVLVLDEPTAALDVRHEMELFELVHALVADGLGALVVTHHLNLAARYASRILLLDGGRAVADGPPLRVLERQVLTRVFGWPVAVTTWCDGSPQVVPLRPADLAHLPLEGT
ncbi:MAG: ABC transporter ATP-binding protein [Gemmatimonadales bacterium]|nr:ABC transporter ATP-binding protein [Gemmatimonadales bacterium]